MTNMNISCWPFKNFDCCPYACFFCNEGCDYCDQPPGNEDCGCFGPRGQECIMCYTCFSPIGFIVDLISCPCRFIGYTKNKCCKQTDEDNPK